MLAVVFCAASAYQDYKWADDWPLSDYHMYSGRQGQRHRQKTLVGVSASQEFALTDDATDPVNSATLRYVLDRVGKDEEKRRHVLDVFRRNYEANRRSIGKGPRLDGLRVYEERWYIEQDLSNISRPKKKLLAEIDYAAPSHASADPLGDDRERTDP